MKPKLSISIVNYNYTLGVINLIDSIYKNTRNVPIEILVTDNCSTDNPERIVTEFPEVKYIANPSNIFFTKADNINLSRATGDYIVSINSDTRIYPRCLEIMMDFLEHNNGAGAAVPKIIYPDGKRQRSIGKQLTATFGIFELTGLNALWRSNPILLKTMSPTIDYNVDKPLEAEMLYGACIMIKREVLTKVGLKDEIFVHGWDEYDWCLRMKKKRIGMFYLPEAVIVHERNASFNKIKDAKSLKQLRRFHRKGLLHYYKKHYNFSVACICSISALCIYPFIACLIFLKNRLYTN